MNNQRLLAVLLGSALSFSALLGACNGGDDNAEPPASDGNLGGETGAGGTGQTPPGITGAGVNLSIEDIEVSDEHVATVEFKVTDDEGRPLDLEGKVSLGAISVSFILSWLDETDEGESKQYVAYTLREKAVPDGESETQSSTDSGGTYEKIDLGHYRYTLGSEIDINEKRSHLTHTLGAYATREVDGTRYVATELESWVPDGSDVSTTLDVVSDTACNSCHTRLEFHGGSRRGVGMCNLCHTEKNSINPESGNTIDFQVMIHKIHMGNQLPSVVAGEPYYFIGYQGHRADYSDVAYPWDMKDCTKCHQGSQGDRWETRPTLKPCASCHDRTWFKAGDPPKGWTAHTAGPRDDSECHVCHAEDSLEPISKSHKTSLTDVDRPSVEAKILSIENSGPGAMPKVKFKVTVDDEPRDLLDDPIARLRLRIWGPNPDPHFSSSATIFDLDADIPITTPACDDSFTPPCLEADGDDFVYYLANAIPADAAGTYMVGMDGRIASPSGNIPFLNPILSFAVTGEVEPRREIVSRDTCNSCHGDMGFHGGGYRSPEYCLNCHNTSAYQDPSGGIMPGGEEALLSINLKDFIHRIHAGVRYPAPLSDCNQCHLEGTQYVPLPDDDLLSSTYTILTCAAGEPDCGGMAGASNTPDEQPYLIPPESAACVSCHDSQSTLAHTETNTGSSGEACGTCHGEGKSLDVAVVHALDP